MTRSLLRLVPLLVAALVPVPLVAQSATIVSQTTAPANKSSCQFHLDRAPTGVTTIETNTGAGDSWEDKTDDYCVDGGATSSPKLKKKSGTIPTGKKIRITVTYVGTTPTTNANETWGTESCD